MAQATADPTSAITLSCLPCGRYCAYQSSDPVQGIHYYQCLGCGVGFMVSIISLEDQAAAAATADKEAKGSQDTPATDQTPNEDKPRKGRKKERQPSQIEPA